MTVHYLMIVECLSLSNNIYENYGLSKSVNIDIASLKIKNAFFSSVICTLIATKRITTHLSILDCFKTIHAVLNAQMKERSCTYGAY